MNKDDKMLWMGDLDPYMDEEFIIESFRKMGVEVLQVKLVNDAAHKGQKDSKTKGYCFFEVQDGDTARHTMLHVNGKRVPGSKPTITFNMSFANSPSVPQTEYNLFVNNVPLELDDAGLFLLFGERYVSCRGAKVYRNYDGSSRGAGFVRFADQTDQQKALVEMNKHVVHGRQIMLKLAQPKYRGPRPPFPNRGNTFGNQNQGGNMQQQQFQQVPQQQQQQQFYGRQDFYPAQNQQPGTVMAPWPPYGAPLDPYGNTMVPAMVPMVSMVPHQAVGAAPGQHVNVVLQGAPPQQVHHAQVQQSVEGEHAQSMGVAGSNQNGQNTSATNASSPSEAAQNSNASNPEHELEPHADTEYCSKELRSTNDEFMVTSEEFYVALDDSRWCDKLHTTAISIADFA